MAFFSNSSLPCKFYPRNISYSPQLMSYSAVAKTALAKEIVAQLDKKNCRAPFLLQTEKSEIFVEPLVSPGVVYVVGAGHVGYATAQLARFTGFDVVVIDDRDEFANSDRFKDVQEVKVIESFVDFFGDLSGDDYVVIVTRGHLHDREVLAQALKTKAGYIGMIGSTQKRNFIYQSLIKGGADEGDLNRINSPIGLDIGADTPNEIALSIVAELVKARAGRGVV